MKRILGTFAVLVLLVLPVLAVAGEDTWIPPEAKWSSEPPTPQQLVRNEKKAVDKADQQTGASQVQAVTPAKEKR